MEDSQLDVHITAFGFPPQHKSYNEAQLYRIYHLDGVFSGWSKHEHGMDTVSQTC